MNANFSLKQYPMWLGLAVAVVLYFVGGGWWLDDAHRVKLTVRVLMVVAFVVGATWPKLTLFPALHLWLGFMLAMTIILFSIGPGTIFPIVLVMGGGMAALAILKGFIVGTMVAVVIRLTIKALRRRATNRA